ncbi:hypothetical protein ERO13_A03G007100v2 [Gossypium hirsutum]|uniref:Uncharacterized protein isoform X3 n=1 Tax=Gossypium hirsutum TaxID=3635 RepID=A0A1U8PEY0_GOSHI|nr:uncharacterized protein LOC107958494 isoform X3 [Gossypium hirsutum]KAG4206395.1 hypothetical protein ERO13_A03G007100v2 [Gossypium hirsutum]
MGDFNEEESDKDKRSRKRVRGCHELVGDLIRMILDGDDRYRTARKWEDKKEIVVEAMNRLGEPQVLLQWLRTLQSRVVENASSSLSVNNAFQVLHSFFNQPTNPVQDLDCVEDLPDSISLIVKALQKEIKVQGQAIVDQTGQLVSEDKVFNMVAKVLYRVLASYLAMLQLTNRVSIQDLVQMEGQPFIFHFPLTSDCSRCAKIHINLQGYHEVHQLLPLFELGNYDARENQDNDARENQDNMKLSHENISTVQGHADFQTILTSSLAEADHKIESNPEMLELENIINMEVMVENMRNNLAKARELKKLEEEIKKNKTNIRKDELKVEKGEADLKENKLKVEKGEAELKENQVKLEKDKAELEENLLKLKTMQKKPRLA